MSQKKSIRRLSIKHMFIKRAFYLLKYKPSNDACNINSQCQGNVVGIALRHTFTSYNSIFNNHLN